MHVDNFAANIENVNCSLDGSVKSEGQAGSLCNLQGLSLVCDP